MRAAIWISVPPGEIEAYKADWSADFNDPDNFIYSFFGNMDNVNRRGFGYTNEDAIARVAAARAIVDEDERIAEYQDLEKLIIQEVPAGCRCSPRNICT